MASDRKEYQKQYYLKQKQAKLKPYLLELIGCLITYALSVLISVQAFQHFSTTFNTIESWIFFAAVEALIFFLSFDLTQHTGVPRTVRVITVIMLTLGLNFIISKGIWDEAVRQKRNVETVENESQLIRTAIKQLDNSISGFQLREMHTKAVEVLAQKDVLLKRLDKLVITSGQSPPENQMVIILMRLFISILNITVVNRIGQILSQFFK